MRAAAPDGVDQHDLGRPYDAKFRPIGGPAGKPLFAGKPTVRINPGSSFRHMTTYMRSTFQLQANLRAWAGLISANASTSTEKRFAFYQAQQQTAIHRLEDGGDIRALVGPEKFYLAEIIYGRAFGLVIYGQESKWVWITLGATNGRLTEATEELKSC